MNAPKTDVSETLNFENYYFESPTLAMIQKTGEAIDQHRAAMVDRGKTLDGYLKLAPTEVIGRHQFVIDEMIQMRLLDRMAGLNKSLN